MAATLDELNARFGIPGQLAFTRGHGNLPCIDVTAPAASARIYLQGAHVAHWQPTGHDPVLFMSQKSAFAPGRPIRGGVPVCFPWFGPAAASAVLPHTAEAPADPALPLHGLARLLEWEVEATRKGGDSVALVLVLKSSPETRRLWPHDFEIRHRITIGRHLIMKLDVLNASDESFLFEEALHTYLAVGDAAQVRITGLEGARYLDKLTRKIETQTGPIGFTAETDRIYLATAAACVLEDPVLRRRIRIEKTGSETTVVWNPWVAKARAMEDFGDEEWPAMACIETCNVAPHPVALEPDTIHQMRAIVSVESLGG